MLTTGFPLSLKTMLLPLAVHRQPQALTRMAQNSLFDRNVISIVASFVVGHQFGPPHPPAPSHHHHR